MNWKTIFAAGAILFSGILYAQTPNDGDTWVPDLIGSWTAEMAGYIFWDVTNPGSVVYDDESGEELVQPSYGESTSDIVITHQTGRAFAGEWDSVEGDRRRLTGVIMPNRTVSIQIFEPSELRMFISGRLKQSGGTLQISGCLQFFDDFHVRHTDPDIDWSDRTMASGYLLLNKID